MNKLQEMLKKWDLRGFIAWVNADEAEKETAGESVLREAETMTAERTCPCAACIQTARSWLDENGERLYRKAYPVLAGIVCATLILVMLAVVNVLPPFGEEDNPTNNEVPAVYIENATSDTGVINSVSGLILNYRGFDTLNESHVLFIATCAVMILLRLDHKKGVVLNKEYEADEYDRNFEPKKDLILQKTSLILVPFILIFGINIMVNGHLSPGGGFSGGAITGGGLILYLVSFGFARSERFFNNRISNIIRIASLTLYTVLMFYFIYMGANGLDNGIDLGTPGSILSAGIILPINLAVGMVVTCTMYGLFSLFRKGGMR